jgi:glycosyltransferase involved in cell wall biosynthesis
MEKLKSITPFVQLDSGTVIERKGSFTTEPAWVVCKMELPVQNIMGKELRHLGIYLHAFYNGGIERVMLSLIRQLLARGVRIDLVVNQLGYSPMWEELPREVNVVDLGVRRFSERLPRLVGYLRKEHPECILSAQHFSNELAIASKLYSRLPVRIVASEHTHLSREFQSMPRFSPRRIGVTLAGRCLYRFADGVVGVSEGVSRDAEKLFGLRKGRSTTIYNPVDMERVRLLGEEAIDHPWFIQDEKPVIVAMGRLEEQKDFATLLRAFAQVRAQRDVRLAVLGEGSQRQALTEQIKANGMEDHVWMPGFIANPYPYLKRAAAFALSSAWEGFAIVLVEAMALGVPVISTRCPSGPDEILQGGKYGALVPVGDDTALALGLLKILDGGAAKPPSEALAPYTAEHVAQQYIEILGS